MAGKLNRRTILFSHYTILQVISNVSIFVISRRDAKTFDDEILAKFINSKSMAGLHTLQIMSVIIYFQIIASTFVEEEKTILDSIDEYEDEFLRQGVDCFLKEVCDHYRTKVFDDFFDPNTNLNSKSTQYQDSFGYTLLAKYVLHFCGQGFEKFNDQVQHTQTGKKRKAPPPVATVGIVAKSKVVDRQEVTSQSPSTKRRPGAPPVVAKKKSEEPFVLPVVAKNHVVDSPEESSQPPASIRQGASNVSGVVHETLYVDWNNFQTRVSTIS